MNFGDNLRTLRKKKKISQEKLGELVGVSRQSVSKWECGEAYPEIDNIFKLCDIFHCKINELVHEDFSDIDSLGEEVKGTLVKFKKEKQKQMKALSKAIYILARIGKIITTLGMIIIILMMFLTPMIASNIEVKEDNTIEVFHKKIEYERNQEKITVTYNHKNVAIIDTEEKFAINKVIDWLEIHSIASVVWLLEVAFTFLVVTFELLYLTLKHLEHLFINIHEGETPFTMENVDHIKKMAIFMIVMIILPNISGMLMQFIIGEDLDISFETFDLIYILFLFSMAYIFEYGYQIQLDSKGRMYGDE